MPTNIAAGVLQLNDLTNDASVRTLGSACEEAAGASTAAAAMIAKLAAGVCVRVKRAGPGV